DVEHRALLRCVDLLAAEHGVDVLTQARLLGKLEQQGQGFVGDAVLGIVEVDSRGFGHESLAALAILGEELLQAGPPDLLVMLLQQRPGRAQVQSRYAHRLFLSLPCESGRAWNRCAPSGRSRISRRTQRPRPAAGWRAHRCRSPPWRSS